MRRDEMRRDEMRRDVHVLAAAVANSDVHVLAAAVARACSSGY